MIWRRSRYTKRCALLLALCGAGSALAETPIFTRDPVEADVLHYTHVRVRAYFLANFNMTVAAPYALAAGRDAQGLKTQLARTYAALGKPARKTPLVAARVCPGTRIGGVANRTFVALCWQEDAQFDAAWAARARDLAGPVMAHEYVHQLQYDLAQDRPARRGADDWLLGPAWLVEGTAEVFERHFRTRGAPVDGVALFELQTPARRSRLNLNDLQTTGALADGKAYGLARFAAFLLAGRHGDAALFDYFTQLGRLGDRKAAFQAAFGQSIEAFEADFETVRRDFGAAKDYVGVE